MLISLILQVFKINLKEIFFYRYLYIFEIVSIFISLIIYHYTSQAFSGSVDGHLENYGSSYFSYIVLGEILLSVPLYYLQAPFRELRSSMHYGILQTMNSLPISIFRIMFVISNLGLFRVLLRTTITLILTVSFFDVLIPYQSWLSLIILQVAAVPFCLGLGLLSASVFMISGRGQALMGYLSTLTGFLAGGLFPIAVLPIWLTDFLTSYFPFTLFLESSRYVISGRSSFNDVLVNSLIILIWGLLLPVSLMAIKGAFSYRKRKGDLVISQY